MTDNVDEGQSSRRNRRQAQADFSARGSIGMKLLASIILSGSVNLLRRCREELFSPEEVAAFHAVDGYYRRAGALPGADALSDLGVVLPSTSEPPAHYFERALERATYNALASDSLRFQEALRQRNVAGAVELLRGMLSSIPAQSGLRDLSTLSEELTQFVDRYNADRWLPGLRGIPTGYAPVDDEINGLLPGDVGVLVGRPGLGKTWTLLHMLTSARAAQHSALVVSMEMTPQQLVKRVVSLHAGLNPKLVQRAQLSEWARRQMLTTIEDLQSSSTPLHFVAGRFRKSVRDIEAYVAELSPDVVYVDGGYLVSPDNVGRYSSKHEKIADVIEGLKGVATDAQIPLVATVQFNREVRRQTRGDLDLAQIGGSDAIGQVASLVMGLRQGPGGREDRRVLEMLKNREGELLKLVSNFSFAPPDFRHMPDEAPDVTVQTNGVDRELARSMV